MTKKSALLTKDTAPPVEPVTPAFAEASEQDSTAPQSPLAGMSVLHAALEQALRDTAATLSLPLGMEGETFTPPLNTHLRGKVDIKNSAAASLGPNPLTRVDGALEITVTTRAGLGQSTAMAVTQSLCMLLPRGKYIQRRCQCGIFLWGIRRFAGLCLLRRVERRHTESWHCGKTSEHGTRLY